MVCSASNQAQALQALRLSAFATTGISSSSPLSHQRAKHTHRNQADIFIELQRRCINNMIAFDTVFEAKHPDENSARRP